MREKAGMAAFVVLLVAVWAVGFLWVRGDLNFGADQVSAGTAAPSASPSTGASASESPSPVAPSSPTAAETYTGTTGPAEERRPVDVNPAPPRPRPVALPPVLQFKMASFNLLGASHTAPGGKAPRMASGAQRINGALQILGSYDISVVGFQEFQGSQRSAFANRAPSWAMYPGNSADGGENSVAWNTDVWDLVKPATVPIPYFGGRARPMPYVLLRHKQTGIQAYFSTFHNPASIPRFGNQQRFRNEATRREIALFNSLEKTGIPQFVTGDMNEREEFFCQVTGATPLIAAAGGSNNGGCRPPPRPIQIDWIMGSPGVQFGGYTVDRSPLVRRTTDHPVVVTGVVVDALKFKSAYAPGPLPVSP